MRYKNFPIFKIFKDNAILIINRKNVDMPGVDKTFISNVMSNYKHWIAKTLVFCFSLGFYLVFFFKTCKTIIYLVDYQ